MPTIGDRLSEKKISWAWYSGGWSDALASHADSDAEESCNGRSHFR